jgi:A/G-specific adenine glycosylase
MNIQKFRHTILAYYRAHGRHDLPWRKTHDPYQILVSEIMLQQTQVSRVLVKYDEFLKLFPTVETLAKAPTAKVLAAWQGLGYNRRALNLRRAAEVVMRDFGGTFPRDAAALESLPGIGQSTRGAVLAFAFGIPTPFIETNIRTVYIDAFFSGRAKVHDKDLLPLIEKTLDHTNPREWYYALMDYGVHLKATRPNPSRKSKHHSTQSRFEGSHRQLRAALLRKILSMPKGITQAALVKEFASQGREKSEIEIALSALRNEGFVSVKRNLYSVT